MTELAGILATLHAWAAVAAAMIAAGLVVLGALDGLGVVAARRGLDRLVLALLVATLLAALLGPGIVIGRAPPADPIHFLYAAVAILAAPLARLEAVRRRSARLGGWLAAGGLVTLGALLRLWGTGG